MPFTLGLGALQRHWVTVCFSETDVNPWLTSQPHGFVHCLLFFLLLRLLALSPLSSSFFPYICFSFKNQNHRNVSSPCIFWLNPQLLGGPWAGLLMRMLLCAVAWPSSQSNMLKKGGSGDVLWEGRADDSLAFLDHSIVGMRAGSPFYGVLLRPSEMANLHSCLYIVVLWEGDCHQTALLGADLLIAVCCGTPKITLNFLEEKFCTWTQMCLSTCRKTLYEKRRWECSSMIQCLPSMREAWIQSAAPQTDGRR